ncbi:MAG: hypothetical protein QE484_15795 [Rhizobium sp.]|nr:hypothetical protein [Rhizobium sp.]
MSIRRKSLRRRGGGEGSRDGADQLTSLQEILLKEAARPVNIVAEGRSQTISMEEVLIRKLLQVAANGGQHAISNAIYLINDAQRLEQLRVAEEVELGLTFKGRQQQRLAEVMARRGDPNTVLPHPNDIVVEVSVGYKIIGPFDETELKRVLRDCEWRDAAILQAALEERLGPPTAGEPADASRHPADATSLFMMQVLNRALPKRFQKTDVQIMWELSRYQGISKRELLKLAHRKWRSLGRPKPRGWRTPRFEHVLWWLENVLPAIKAVYPEVRGGKLVDVEAIAVRLQRMIGSGGSG